MSTFGPYAATVVAIHDGDTIDVDVVLHPQRVAKSVTDLDLGFSVHLKAGVGVVLERQSVRLFGCNAAELATLAGKLALAHIETLVKVGDVVELVSRGWDKYGGRIDGSVKLTDGRDLSATMIADGYAAAWDGVGAKPVPGAPA